LTFRKAKLESEFSLIRKRKQDIYKTWEISNTDEVWGLNTFRVISNSAYQVSMVLGKLGLESWISKELDKNTPSRPTHLPAPQLAENTPFTYQRSNSSPSPPPPGDVFRALDPLPGNDATQDNLQNASGSGEQILCVHGLLDPAKSASMKRISKVWLFVSYFDSLDSPHTPDCMG
jgi:hypothetical protein